MILSLCMVIIPSQMGIYILGEMHGIMRQAWCYDRWHTLTTDDFICNNNYKHNTLYVLSVQATV